MTSGGFPRWPGFPGLKSAPTRSGGLEIGIGTQGNLDIVMLRFSYPLTWMGLAPRDARLLAEELVKRAEEIEARGRVIVP
jgi:hypothetical protein